MLKILWDCLPEPIIY
uniref:Uncharacterized protein n=1 Tax=Arundo donax TaxID=35708 RepID=A0A0A8ZTT4_ARUDO